MEKNKEKDDMNGQMGVFMKVNGTITKLMDMFLTTIFIFIIGNI